MKPTIATVKSFINKNKDRLFVRIISDFDPMIDCVQHTGQGFHPVTFSKDYLDHNHGINGIWFVGRSRDYVSKFEDLDFIGYKVTNSCGSWQVAIKI